MGFYGWRPYVSAAQRRRQAAGEMAKLKKKGHPVSPVVVEGRAIVKTFWGKAWCENLERYSDFENRLPRGRTYVRNGSVIDLQIAPGEIKALVSGFYCHPHGSHAPLGLFLTDLMREPGGPARGNWLVQPRGSSRVRMRAGCRARSRCRPGSAP